MLHGTTTTHMVPYVMFAAAWAFICGVVFASVPAHGQPNSSSPAQDGNITIQAPPPTGQAETVPGRIYAPPTADVFSLSQTVNLGDLDLSKPADAAEFKQRVTQTAQDVCRRLNSRFPRTLHQFYDSRNCVKSAVDNALAATAKRTASAD